MKRQIRRIIASMLTVTTVLSNSNLAVFAEEAGIESQSVMVEEQQEEQQEETEVSGEELKEEQQEKTEVSGEELQEEQQEETETPGEELPENQTEVLDDDSEKVNLTLELLSDEGTDKADVTIRTVEELVNLSKKNAQEYQNKSIMLAPHDTEEWDLSGTEFAGLGSDNFPFKGEIGFSGSYTGYITLNKSLFNAISGDAKINSTLNLRAADNMTDPILAKSYVAGENADSSQPIHLNIDAESKAATEENSNYSSFGGIIGTLGENASVSLEVTSVIPAAKTAVSGEGNKGFFCNTMKEGSSLSLISFTGNSDFNVTSTNEAAGALVGCMTANANLTVGTEFAYSGSVTGAQNAGGLVGCTAAGAQINLNENYTVRGSISSGNGNAGGLIGLAENNPVSITSGKKVSITNASLSANGTSGAAGGLFGFGTISQGDSSLDLAAYSVEGVTITSGKYAGGVFGVLQNGVENDGTHTYTIMMEVGVSGNVSSTGKGVENYGGLIGKYDAKNLASALELNNLQLTSVHNGTKKTAYAGVIAEVTGKSYVKMDDLTVAVDQIIENGSYFGGLVANCSVDDASGFFDIGTVTISSENDNTVNKDGASGGLVGNLTDGVVRLYGKTDLSGIQPGGEGSQYGQLVGKRGTALVYAVGTGSNCNADGGWTLVRDGSSKYVSDIGNWGEVIRVDGSTLSELIGTDGNTSNPLLTYDNVGHTVTVKSFDPGNISNEQDFTALALTMQCSNAKREGALHLSGSAGMNSQITLTANINLEKTGVTGLMRDDGTQDAFTGKLNGGNHTLTLDIGDVYGVKADGKTECVAADAGCGQIYNHSYLGLFAKTGNLAGGISNLTISGSINYGLISKEEIWVGGVTALQEKGTASYQNITSDLAISFIGKTSGTTRVGGFVGEASGSPELTFTNCCWKGTITDHATTDSDCYLGGYVGSMDSAGGSITLTNSSIGNGKNAKASIHTENQSCTVSKTGGILAVAENDSKNKITITVDGFAIDGFDISSTATESTGGFLGYDWRNVDFTVSGLSIANATLNAKNAGFGGLVYEAAGHWIVKEPDASQNAGQTTETFGIKYGTNVSFSGKSVDDTPSALLVCRGDDYRNIAANEGCALYLQLNSKAAYQVDSSVNVALNSGKYFDELVGISMSENGNGVVSIATENHEKLNRSSCNTYQKQLRKDYDNPHTRYYYNLDQFKKAEGDIESGEDLIMWSLGQDAEWNIKDYFRVEDKNTYTKVRTVKGTIDLTGLSYYPIDYAGKINIDNADIIFDYAQINTCEENKNNKTLDNPKKQHYMMQTGLFRNLTSQDTYAAGITVKNGSKLSGCIGQTAEGHSAHWWLVPWGEKLHRTFCILRRSRLMD